MTTTEEIMTNSMEITQVNGAFVVAYARTMSVALLAAAPVVTVT